VAAASSHFASLAILHFLMPTRVTSTNDYFDEANGPFAKQPECDCHDTLPVAYLFSR
jgi:hypothetical protein